jgi:hypothetical protein
MTSQLWSIKESLKNKLVGSKGFLRTITNAISNDADTTYSKSGWRLAKLHGKHTNDPVIKPRLERAKALQEELETLRQGV